MDKKWPNKVFSRSLMSIIVGKFAFAQVGKANTVMSNSDCLSSLSRTCFKTGIKIFIIAILFCNSSEGLFAQNIPSRFKLPIVFLAVPDENGIYQFNGTGFIYIIPMDSLQAWLYLVTDKHVVVSTKTRRPYETVLVRVNTLTDSSRVFSIHVDTAGPHKDIFFHPDPTVDLAVFSITLNPKLVKWQSLGDEMGFKSREEFDSSYVKEGTNIFYTGMFSPYLGYKKNIPITRFGRVCLISEEKLQWDNKDPTDFEDLFLVETTTYGGNSGSPVFSYGLPYGFQDTSHMHAFDKDSIKLIGVIKGYYGEKAPIETQLTSAMIPTYTSNVGVTAVIPSYLVYQILYSAELERRRHEEIKKNNQSKKK